MSDIIPINSRIDIRSDIESICRKFGLVYNNVGRLVLEPSGAVATIYKVDSDGSKYIDQETGEAATEERRFKVMT